MSKRIVILSASPRKGGNSDMLCDRFMQGAQEAGHDVEKIRVHDAAIGYCLGCEQCRKNGGKCVQQDDMAEILEKMEAADVIVMATPVYFYSMNGQMKTLIDRTVPRYAQLKGKEFYFIATAADGGEHMLERTFEGFRGFTACLDGAEEKGVVYGAGAWKKGDIRQSPSMRRVYEYGLRA